MNKEESIMIVEVYECEDGSITAVPADNIDKENKIGKNPTLIREIKGRDWDHCAEQYYNWVGLSLK